MATINQAKAKWIKRLGGGTSKPEIEQYPEAASQSFLKGQLIYLSSGKVTACADDAQVVFGLAMQDASTTTNTLLDILVLTPLDVLSMNVYHSTAASAITAVAQVGENYALQVDSNKNYCDIEDVTNVLMRVIKLDPRDATGDTYGRVWVTIQGNYLQTGQAG